MLGLTEQNLNPETADAFVGERVHFDELVGAVVKVCRNEGWDMYGLEFYKLLAVVAIIGRDSVIESYGDFIASRGPSDIVF